MPQNQQTVPDTWFPPSYSCAAPRVSYSSSGASPRLLSARVLRPHYTSVSAAGTSGLLAVQGSSAQEGIANPAHATAAGGFAQAQGALTLYDTVQTAIAPSCGPQIDLNFANKCKAAWHISHVVLAVLAVHATPLTLEVRCMIVYWAPLVLLNLLDILLFGSR